MANILTEAEAKGALGYDESQDMPARVMTVLLPAVANFLKDATGKDWSLDASIDPTAKLTASMMLARWFDNPSQVGTTNTSFSFGPDIGMTSLIAQLQAKALVGGTT